MPSTPVRYRVVSQASQPPGSAANWLPAFWFAALLLLSYAVVLGKLARLWVTDASMSHGAFVPLLVGYIVWERRHALAALQPAHNWFGLVLLVLGGLLLCVGPPGLDTFASLTRAAFWFSLLGSLLYMLGFSGLRLLLYPLALLLLMFPIPAFILDILTFPLQVIASKLAEHMLEFLGFSVLREGNILVLPGQTLNVADACSGLRSLIALTFLGQAYIYLFDSRPWMRVVMAILVVPIAVLANALRILATAVAASYNRKWGDGSYHEWTGWVVFVVAFTCIICAHLLIKTLGARLRVK